VKMFDAGKTRMIGYCMLKKLGQYVKPFSSDTGARYGQTDGRTDGLTDRIAISISRVSVLTRDKNQVASFFLGGGSVYDGHLTSDYVHVNGFLEAAHLGV